MKIESVETTVVSTPYKHRESSAQVQRDGVTSIIVRVTTDDGTVGWGESCSGGAVRSVLEALLAMEPFVVGRSPWERELIRDRLWWHGLWQFLPSVANFAWAGVDIALWDICGKQAGLPVHQLLGGPRRSSATYFYYLSRGSREDLTRQCQEGLEAGFEAFYLKVGLGFVEDLEMIAAARDALGDRPRLRVDANAAWSLPDALRYVRALEAYDLDFIEQPVPESPTSLMRELRSRTNIPLAANEGLWTRSDAYLRIKERVADVYCFSPYWVGSLADFVRLAEVAAYEGARVCKHTHGEFGIAATAAHHGILATASVVEGHQQTAWMLDADILAVPVPTATGPRWGLPDAPGLGVEVDPDALRQAAARYDADGQFLPYQEATLAPTSSFDG